MWAIWWGLLQEENICIYRYQYIYVYIDIALWNRYHTHTYIYEEKDFDLGRKTEYNFLFAKYL